MDAVTELQGLEQIEFQCFYTAGLGGGGNVKPEIPEEVGQGRGVLPIEKAIVE